MCQALFGALVAKLHHAAAGVNRHNRFHTSAGSKAPDAGVRGSSSTRILLNPIGALRLAQLPKPKASIELLIGAEGGLSQAEIDTALSQGFQSVVLGARILRTETAALTAIAAMQTLWGDF